MNLHAPENRRIMELSGNDLGMSNIAMSEKKEPTPDERKNKVEKVRERDGERWRE